VKSALVPYHIRVRKYLPTLNDFVVMRCFLEPRCPNEKKLLKLVRKLSWSLYGYKIMCHDRLYDNVDKWLYETQCIIDEPNRIISVYTTLKRLDKDAFAHSLCCSSIKYKDQVLIHIMD
jgi:hypothetical protein